MSQDTKSKVDGFQCGEAHMPLETFVDLPEVFVRIMIIERSYVIQMCATVPTLLAFAAKVAARFLNPTSA